MAMRTASPWWASLGFGLGLLFFIIGERAFGHEPGGIRYVLTGAGVGLIVAVTAARGWAAMATSGARRRVERTLLICHVGTLLAIFVYMLTTKWGITFDEKSNGKGILTVLYAILFIASVVPVLMIELSLGVAMRTNFDVHESGRDEVEGVEYLRVRDMGWSGLTVAFAAAFLMVTCKVATERNIQRDVSYFKTSSPGDSTQKIVAASAEPITVHLFFPEANEVGNQVKSYFEALAAASGKVTVEEHDRLADAELAGTYKVTKDGVIVIVRGTGDKAKSQTIDIDTDIEKARKGSGKLRNLDREVNAQLMKVVREKRKAYIVTGHGELTNPESMPADVKGRVQERRTTVFKKRISDLNYESKDLGLIDLARDVPDDATIVMLMAPTVALQDAEWAALARYLDRGGRLLVTLDPKSEPSLGPLEGKLGYKFNPSHLTDEKSFLPQRQTISDRRYVITTQFSAHSSTTALSRSVDKGLVLIDAGAIEDAPFTSKGEQPKKTVTIRSMETSFLDNNDNLSFDATGPRPEKKQRWNIGAAVEGPKQGDKDGFRALLFADSDLFADVMVQSARGTGLVMVSGPLLDDSVRWLGGEEVFSGEVVSEDDKPIQHTKSQDAVWFTLTIVGAPLLVLTLGLIGTWARRRRARKSEVTQ
ncbi:MAG: Gldg family protein [Deltaproteobacteria bacterium]|nr:Gldg family protein [Deltaproteobacteria bacterium]